MFQNNPPDNSYSNLTTTFLHLLHQSLQNAGITEAQFANTAGLSARQWARWQKEGLWPTLAILDRHLLANKLLLNFDLTQLESFEGNLRDFLVWADTSSLQEISDISSHTFYLDQSGRRRAFVQETKDQPLVFVDRSLGQGLDHA